MIHIDKERSKFKFKVQFLLNANCFFTILKLKGCQSETIHACCLNAWSQDRKEAIETENEGHERTSQECFSFV